MALPKAQRFQPSCECGQKKWQQAVKLISQISEVDPALRSFYQIVYRRYAKGDDVTKNFKEKLAPDSLDRQVADLAKALVHPARVCAFCGF